MSLLLVRATVWAAVLVVMAAAAGSDFKRRIVPNEAVALVAVGGLVLSLLARPGSTFISLLLALTVMLTLLVVAHFNLLGAGDAKLIAAATLLVPPDRVAPLLLGIAVAGGVLSGIYLVAFRAMKHGGRRATGFFAHVRHADRSVPYAVAILGGVALYFASELYQCSSGISCSL